MIRDQELRNIITNGVFTDAKDSGLLNTPLDQYCQAQALHNNVLSDIENNILSGKTLSEKQKLLFVKKVFEEDYEKYSEEQKKVWLVLARKILFDDKGKERPNELLPIQYSRAQNQGQLSDNEITLNAARTAYDFTKEYEKRVKDFVFKQDPFEEIKNKYALFYLPQLNASEPLEYYQEQIIKTTLENRTFDDKDSPVQDVKSRQHIAIYAILNSINPASANLSEDISTVLKRFKKSFGENPTLDRVAAAFDLPYRDKNEDDDKYLERLKNFSKNKLTKFTEINPAESDATKNTKLKLLAKEDGNKYSMLAIGREILDDQVSAENLNPGNGCYDLIKDGNIDNFYNNFSDLFGLRAIEQKGVETESAYFQRLLTADGDINTVHAGNSDEKTKLRANILQRKLELVEEFKAKVNSNRDLDRRSRSEAEISVGTEMIADFIDFRKSILTEVDKWAKELDLSLSNYIGVLGPKINEVKEKLITGLHEAKIAQHKQEKLQELVSQSGDAVRVYLVSSKVLNQDQFDERYQANLKSLIEIDLQRKGLPKPKDNNVDITKEMIEQAKLLSIGLNDIVVEDLLSKKFKQEATDEIDARTSKLYNDLWSLNKSLDDLDKFEAYHTNYANKDNFQSVVEQNTIQIQSNPSLPVIRAAAKTAPAFNTSKKMSIVAKDENEKIRFLVEDLIKKYKDGDKETVEILDYAATSPNIYGVLNRKDFSLKDPSGAINEDNLKLVAQSYVKAQYFAKDFLSHKSKTKQITKSAGNLSNDVNKKANKSQNLTAVELDYEINKMGDLQKVGLFEDKLTTRDGEKTFYRAGEKENKNAKPIEKRDQEEFLTQLSGYSTYDKASGRNSNDHIELSPLGIPTSIYYDSNGNSLLRKQINQLNKDKKEGIGFVVLKKSDPVSGVVSNRDCVVISTKKGVTQFFPTEQNYLENIQKKYQAKYEYGSLEWQKLIRTALTNYHVAQEKDVAKKEKMAEQLVRSWIRDMVVKEIQEKRREEESEVEHNYNLSLGDLNLITRQRSKLTLTNDASFIKSTLTTFNNVQAPITKGEGVSVSESLSGLASVIVFKGLNPSNNVMYKYLPGTPNCYRKVTQIVDPNGEVINGKKYKQGDVVISKELYVLDDKTGQVKEYNWNERKLKNLFTNAQITNIKSSFRNTAIQAISDINGERRIDIYTKDVKFRGKLPSVLSRSNSGKADEVVKFTRKISEKDMTQQQKDEWEKGKKVEVQINEEEKKKFLGKNNSAKIQDLFSHQIYVNCKVAKEHNRNIRNSKGEGVIYQDIESNNTVQKGRAYIEPDMVYIKVGDKMLPKSYNDIQSDYGDKVANFLFKNIPTKCNAVIEDEIADKRKELYDAILKNDEKKVESILKEYKSWTKEQKEAFDIDERYTKNGKNPLQMAIDLGRFTIKEDPANPSQKIIKGMVDMLIDAGANDKEVIMSKDFKDFKLGRTVGGQWNPVSFLFKAVTPLLQAVSPAIEFIDKKLASTVRIMSPSSRSSYVQEPTLEERFDHKADQMGEVKGGTIWQKVINDKKKDNTRITR